MGFVTEPWHSRHVMLYVSMQLRGCSSHALSHLRALFRVRAWCSDPGPHVLSIGFVSGIGQSRFTFCLFVGVCSLEFAQPRALLSPCIVFVLHAVRVFIGCVHSCYVLCCVAQLSPRLYPSPQSWQYNLANRGLCRDGHLPFSVSHHRIVHPHQLSQRSLFPSAGGWREGLHLWLTYWGGQYGLQWGWY